MSRKINDRNLNKFIQSMKDKNMDDISELHDPEIGFTMFQDLLNTEFEKHFPLEKI